MKLNSRNRKFRFWGKKVLVGMPLFLIFTIVLGNNFLEATAIQEKVLIVLLWLLMAVFSFTQGRVRPLSLAKAKS